MTPLFLTADQVASALGLANAKAFLRQRARLQADTLFPLPMPTQHKPLRWKADEVQAWIARHGTATPPQMPAAPPPVVRPASRLIALARTA